LEVDFDPEGFLLLGLVEVEEEDLLLGSLEVEDVEDL